MSDIIRIENGKIVEYQNSPYIDGIGAYVFDEGCYPITAKVQLNGKWAYLTANGIYQQD